MEKTMPNTGHPSFDKTVEKTNRILKEIEPAEGAAKPVVRRSEGGPACDP
jgi:hypothetical protein